MSEGYFGFIIHAAQRYLSRFPIFFVTAHSLLFGLSRCIRPCLEVDLKKRWYLYFQTLCHVKISFMFLLLIMPVQLLQCANISFQVYTWWTTWWSLMSSRPGDRSVCSRLFTNGLTMLQLWQPAAKQDQRAHRSATPLGNACACVWVCLSVLTREVCITNSVWRQTAYEYPLQTYVCLHEWACFKYDLY